MAVTYWSYVSQEIDHIREQFDAILEKEIAFQEAMHSFYTPSSKKLVGEIESLRDRFETIANQTNQIDEQSSSSVQLANEAENKMKTFVEALELYKETQQEQQKLLTDAQKKSEQEISKSLNQFNQTIEEQAQLKEDQLKTISKTVLKLEEQNTNLLGRITGNINQGKETIQNWVDWKEQNKSTYTQLNDEIMKIVTSYHLESLQTAYENMNNEIQKLAESDLQGEWIVPIKPEDEESLSVDQLKAFVADLETEIMNLKNSEENTNAENNAEDPPEGDANNEGGENTNDQQNGMDWTSVENSLESVKNEITTLEAKTGQEDLNNYIEVIENLNDKLLNNFDDIKSNLVNRTENKQAKIIELIKDEDKKLDLQERFNQLKKKDRKTFTALMNYNDALNRYETMLVQQGPSSVVAEKIEELNIDDKINQLFSQVKTTYTSKLQPIFGVSDEEVMTLQEQKESFTEQISAVSSMIEEYKKVIEQEQQHTEKLLESMQTNVAAISGEIDDIVTNPFEWEESPSIQYLDGKMIFQTQQGTLDDMEQLSDSVASLGESQSNITESTEKLQQNVGNVQSQSDELNNRWSVNVASTEKVKDDVYDVLGNTVVDGQSNPIVYDYLSDPVQVQVQGQTKGKVLTQEEDRIPPVILFIIILISGLLIGFLSHYYAGSSLLVQSGLFLILTVSVGLIISVYGLNIYALDEAQSIKWSFITIVLLLACANIIRGSLFIGPFIGWIASIVMIVFFVTPLIDIVVPDFSFSNPIANVYMSLQYGNESGLYLTMAILLILSVIISAMIYGWQLMRNKQKVNANEESVT
ncbi:hypothetical protein ACLIBG_03030 [Virgibacillus sp. W0181]|uniref:hypothetical protein n=1 Tax=Virgibacillus sp. W0181 TaxID=3391581 RepID=UPI003F462BC9